MAENSKIEWCDHTFNPWEGCQKVGPGCDHCYAEARNTRFGSGVAINWGPGAPRRRTSAANWAKPRAWNAQAAREGRRYRVFCASLADVFDNAVDQQWRDDLFALINVTPHLDWLLLTKRIGNVDNMLPVPFDFSRIYPNVWIGATLVNRDEMLRDAPKLRAVDAAVTFWSVEPMLGDFGHLPLDLLPSWVICGGESGHGARPMHPGWARSLRDQCAAAGVPFLFKQWGEHAVHEVGRDGFLEPGMSMRMRSLKRWRDGAFVDIPGNSPVGENFYVGAVLANKVGKAESGRLLDGIEHNGFPEVP